ncbi:hypothetical protein KY329_05230 [Candidatus Woesearchaeota archaeon]|nr:hypothetical protein [Candidatus Woesearchaeota archaeon]
MRAQITVFIILGVLILAAFAVVIYVATSMARTETRKPSTEGTQSVQDYISSCLESVSKEGIVSLGRQGGYLFDFQGGLTSASSVPTVKYEGFNVAFDILPPEGAFSFYQADPPVYPYDKFPYIAGNISFTGFYGLNRLPALFNMRQSIRSSLEAFISTGMASCADFTGFSNMKVTAGPATASIILAGNKTHLSAEHFFTVLLDWPLNITYANGEKLELREFAVKVPVRLASVYYFVNELINKDVSDINYEPHADKGFDVSIEKISSGSVVKILDPVSELEDAPYEFWFARMNRAPALWYIDVGGLSSVYTGTKVSIHNNVLKIEDVCEDEDYEFPLFASDPDNDTVSFKLDDSGFASAPGPSSFTVYARDGSLEDYQVLDFNIVQCP